MDTTSPSRSSISTEPIPPPTNKHFLTGIRRPHRHLLIYYALSSLLFGPFFPIAFLFGFFRFRSLEYQFDDEGVTMRWGILFRREISLAYARLQDIHLSSNVVERWLGLARVQLQTAAGSAVAEMTIEGLLEFEEVRDFLYSKMRGTQSLSKRASSSNRTETMIQNSAQLNELIVALQETTRELRDLRHDLAQRKESKP